MLTLMERTKQGVLVETRIRVLQPERRNPFKGAIIGCAIGLVMWAGIIAAFVWWWRR